MANYFPTRAKVSPSFTEPDLIITYAQPSGAFAALEGSKPRIKIGSEDMVVYINRLDLRTDVLTGQSPANHLPSATLVGTYFQTPTYLIRTRAVWDHHDIARASDWAVALPTAQDMAQRQGIFQQMRTGLLYGFNPANGEGLLNTAGATAVTLPPDPNGNTTVSTYDNGAMALFFLNQCVALKSRMYQSGGQVKNRIIVVGPQRVFLQLAYANIVQTTAYQRPGAGTATTGEVIRLTAEASGDQFEWYFDDTLIGQGSGGADAVLLTIPEIEAPPIPGLLNTNEFGARMTPQMKAVNLMYADMPAPMKIPTPTPDGAITELQELRVTSGWCIRPQGITVLSMPH
jgi:hypothetical protein